MELTEPERILAEDIVNLSIREQLTRVENYANLIAFVLFYAAYIFVIYSANATPEGVLMIKEGRILASAAFDAMSMAGLAAEAAVRHLRGEIVPKSILLPATLVDQDNLEYWDRPYEERSMYPWDDAVAGYVVD